MLQSHQGNQGVETKITATIYNKLVISLTSKTVIDLQGDFDASRWQLNCNNMESVCCQSAISWQLNAPRQLQLMCLW